MISYDLFNMARQLQQELARNVPARDEESAVATSRWVPAVDIQEQPDRFVIYADVPGVAPQDIEITMENGVLTFKGERNIESEAEQNGYKRVERVRGSFYRRFSLPDTADAERINAKAVNGVLEITLPKREQLKPRRIAIS